MTAMLKACEAGLEWAWRTNWQAAVLVGLILLAQAVLGRRLSPGVRYALWALVAVRLVLPATPASRVSIFNLAGLVRSGEAAPVVEPKAETAAKTTVTVTWPEASEEDRGKAAAAPPALVSPPYRSERAWDWKIVLVGVWIVGGIALALRTVVANVRLGRRLRGAAGIEDAELLALLEECKREMKVGAAVELAQTDAVSSPALWGMWRPKILLPAGLAGKLSAAEMRFVLLHELAHLKRRDIWADWGIAMLRVVHWFNPAVWVAFARCRIDRELARDAMVLSTIGRSEIEGYGMTILKLVEGAGVRPGTVGILEEKGQLKRRITMIAGFRRNVLGSIVAAGMLMTAIGVAGLTDRRVAAAAAPPAAQPAPDPAGPVPARAERGAAPAAAKEKRVTDEQLREMMERKIPEIRFEEMALSDVMDFLRDTTGANIYVNWKALAAAGVERSQQVTARLRDVRFSKVLSIVLADAAGGENKLAYRVDDGVITISTVADLRQPTVVQVYDVRDLVDRSPVAVGVKENGAREFPLLGKGEGRAEAIKKSENEKAATEEIAKLILDNMDKAKWGADSKIHTIAGQLIVSTTAENHEQVGRILAVLRKAKGVQVSVEVRLLSVDPAILENIRDEAGGTWKMDWAPLPKSAVTSPREGVRGVYLNAKKLNELIRTAQGNKETSIISAPRVVVFNAQEGIVRIGQEETYISAIALTTKANGETDYVPAMSTLETGVFLNMQPSVSADRKFVTMHVQPSVRELKELEKVPYEGAPGKKDLYTQRPVMNVRALDAMVPIPDGQTLALSGFRLVHNPGTPLDDGEAVKNLIVLVKPTVIEKW